MENQYNIKIRPIRIEDYEWVLNWSKDETFCMSNGWELNRSEIDLYDWWLRCVIDESRDFTRLGIEIEERLIGYIDVVRINDVTAELGIAIGERDWWGKGIGSSSISKVMEGASEELGIKVFKAETHEANMRSRKMLEKIGFKEISRIGAEDYFGTENTQLQFEFVLKESRRRNAERF